MRKLYEDNPDMTAVFISNYEMTVGAMMEINDLGIKVPEQLSVIGFDNMDFARAVVHNRDTANGRDWTSGSKSVIESSRR